MTETRLLREYTLDQPGSAGRATIRRGIVFAAVIVGMAGAVAAFGDIWLAPYPQFATFHAGFVFLVDAITAFLLFGQFAYRRLPSYLVLAAAFLFSALTMIPFLLSLPEANGGIIGGTQSAIWVWHFWHTLFPAIIGLSLLVHERSARPVPGPRVVRSIATAAGVVVVLVALGTVAVTVFHDLLPRLIHDDTRTPFKPNFYWASGVVVVVTVVSFLLALRLARQRTILHIWLAVVLLALLADEAASLGAYPRYAVGWYFGRIDSMFAASALLVVLLTEISRIYQHLAAAAHELFDANNKLSALIGEKDALLAELRESEEQIRHMAYHDPVTDLPNRRMLMEGLAHILAQAQRHGHSTALLFLDLDKFKSVNDTLGHEVGDALLREVAARLKRCVRGGDTVARLGGDEFVIVLPEISGPHDAMAVADKALDLITEPITVMGHTIHVTCSIGIAISARGQYLSADELLREADEAMYAAKEAGRNRYRLSNVGAATLATPAGRGREADPTE